VKRAQEVVGVGENAPDGVEWFVEHGWSRQRLVTAFGLLVQVGVDVRR
jgi:hypothetical protein